MAPLATGDGPSDAPCARSDSFLRPLTTAGILADGSPNSQQQLQVRFPFSLLSSTKLNTIFTRKGIEKGKPDHTKSEQSKSRQNIQAGVNYKILSN
jgi:hypothetical protein